MKNCVYVNVTVFGMSMSQKSRERKAPRIDTSAAGGSPAFFSPLVPFVLSLGPSVLPQLAVVPLTVLWGLAYALPFYIPPGEFAMQIGGKKGTALFTNIFDASGFAASALWNPWASALAKNNDFKTILYSQALFGAMSALTMPLCMYRQMLKEQATKKKE